MSTFQVTVIGIQIVLIIAAGVAAYYGFIARVNGRLDKLEAWVEMRRELVSTDRIANIEGAVHKMSADNDVFWKVIEPHLANIIHSPVHRDRDRLIDKLVNGKLKKNETYQLITELRVALDDPDWSPDKKLAGALLLARVLATDDQRRGNE